MFPSTHTSPSTRTAPSTRTPPRQLARLRQFANLRQLKRLCQLKRPCSLKRPRQLTHIRQRTSPSTHILPSIHTYQLTHSHAPVNSNTCQFIRPPSSHASPSTQTRALSGHSSPSTKSATKNNKFCWTIINFLLFSLIQARKEQKNPRSNHGINDSLIEEKKKRRKLWERYKCEQEGKKCLKNNKNRLGFHNQLQQTDTRHTQPPPPVELLTDPPPPPPHHHSHRAPNSLTQLTYSSPPTAEGSTHAPRHQSP